MRPSVLNPLYARAGSLDGVGDKMAKTLARLLGPPSIGETPRVLDVLWHLPNGVIDRELRPNIAALADGETGTVRVRVEEHRTSRGRGPYRVLSTDDSGTLELVFFHADTSYLKRLLPVGEDRYVSGRAKFYSGQAQMAHPDYVLGKAELAELPAREPVYPLVAGLTVRQLRKIIAQALKRVPELAEWQRPDRMAQTSWPSFHQALAAAHAPGSVADLQPMAPARARLACDELLASQLSLALVRERLRRLPGRSLITDGPKRTAAHSALPFELTTDQQGALAEIDTDLASTNRMIRLLQGDVGSGKTAVGFLAMAAAADNGSQAALMAPTEVLARQHFRTLSAWTSKAGLTVDILTGRDKGSVRRQRLEALASGEIDILVGTHALFQEGVDFKDLALIVIDEQHRFGVHQRLALQGKAERPPDVLVMTATPIPRTLLLTHYGDVDVSAIREKPAGRPEITTRVVSSTRMNEMVEGLKRAVAKGEQVFWICPLVEDSDQTELRSVEKRHRELSTEFGDRVGLIHGRLHSRDKDAAIDAFAAKETSILVATTVIEVGIDVPDATIIVIEHAERFGLAQLHQLRGRVGRGTRPSACVLLYDPPLSETAGERLQVMRETNDGFRIAEADLKLRGGGELLGARQSGEPGFHIADLSVHADSLMTARDDAKLILNTDPDLKSERGQALRALLYLFERDEAVRLLRSG